MIYTELTKGHLGIILFGDYYDLRRVHTIIHHTAEAYEKDSPANDHLVSFAYEIRKAHQGEREKAVSNIPGLKARSTYFGAKFFLPHYILSINLMRNAFTHERLIHQTAVLLDITGDINQTAEDTNNIEFIKSHRYWLENTLISNDPYLSLLLDLVTLKYIETKKAERLNQIGELMNWLHPYTEQYKMARLELEQIARAVKKDLKDLEGLRMPNVKTW